MTSATQPARPLASPTARGTSSLDDLFTVSARPVAARTARTSALPGVVARWPVATATLVGACGLLIQACGYSLGWGDHEAGGLVLWYVGYVVIVAPFAALLLAPLRTDHQRLGGSLVVTLLVYASWLLSNPVLSTRFDESLHVTTLVDLLQGDGFFHPNSMLPVSPHYPGLELATAGVAWLTGLPVFACEVIVVLIARVTLVVSLFLIASRITRSSRVGAITVLLYVASPQFYFFNAQFSYQTVAIAMLMAALYLTMRAYDAEEGRAWRPMLAAQVCLAGLAVTHHITSWLVLGAIWILTGLFALGGDRHRFRVTLVTAEIATLVVACWTALITPLLLNYLGPIFTSAGDQVRAILSDDGGGRTIGSDTGGVPTPHWELLTIAASILVWIAMLTPACWAAWRRSSLGSSRARYLPLVLAAAYPFLQLTRFSAAAAEIGDRASTFVAMAMALVVGVWLAPRLHRLRMLVVPGAVLLVLGGTILGAGPDWQRMTGPYLAGAEQRSVDAETLAVAEWAGRYLPAGSRIAADSTFARVLPNYAPVQAVNGGVANMTPLFISTSIGRYQQQLIQDFDVDFVVVDTRLIGTRPRTGAFFPGSADYPGADYITAPEFDKFQGATGFDLVLDGPVRIYDVRSLRGARSTFADRPDGGLPGSWSPWRTGVTVVALGAVLLVRRKLLDPRRFTSGDQWRPAVLLPGAMLIGAVGVLIGFPGWLGAALLVVLAAGLVLSTRSAPALPRRQSSSPWLISVVAANVVALACVVAFVSAYDALTSAPFPPPPPALASQAQAQAQTQEGGGTP